MKSGRKLSSIATWSFRAKVAALTASSVALALVMSSIGLIGMQYQTDRSLSERRHEQIARVVSANVAPALLFADQVTALETLESARGIEDIGPFRIVAVDGTIFVDLNPAGAQDVPQGYWSHTITQPIAFDGDVIGELQMDVHTQGLWDILRETWLAALVIFALCLTMAYFVSRWLNMMAFKPIDRLVATMHTITSSGDYSTRLPPEPDHDFSIIATNFNAMLGEVESRSAALTENAEELRQARDASEEANLAKSQFLANMSHELRTPLNAIIGYTEVLHEELEEAQMARSVEDVQWIYSSAQQLLQLINGILDLSKIEAGRMDVEIHEFDVRELLREVNAMLEPLALQKGNQLHLQIDPAITIANTDSAKLRQCLLNLSSNACKFTENGHIFLLARQEGQNLIFSVSDTGIGMSRDEITRLFRPFTQADASTTRRFGGTGLGLTITGRFASLLGGAIEVESEPGNGSAFTLTIKANLGAKPGTVDVAALSPAAPLARGDRPLAIIADDQDSAVQLLSRMAGQAGYDTLAAGDGEECLALARQYHPDLILLDIGMPKMNGWDVLEVLAHDQTLATIPTVVVSVDESRRAAMNAGACDHLIKPVSRDEINEIFSQYAKRDSGRVLLVEDDQATSRLYARGISQMGYDSDTAHSGEEALRRLAETQYDYVVTDLRMPDGDGFDLIETISGFPEGSRPTVIVMTGKVLDQADLSKLHGKVADLLAKNGLSPRKLAQRLMASNADTIGDTGEAA